MSAQPSVHEVRVLRLLTFSQSAEVVELHVGRQRHVLSGDLGLLNFVCLQIGGVTVQEMQRRNIQLGSDPLSVCKMDIKYS